MSIQTRISGEVLEAKTASFLDDNQVQQTYGKIQIMTPDMSGEFYQIQNIKVRKEHFGWIPDIEALKGKQITLDLDQSNYQGKVSYYLANPIKKVA